MHQKKFCFSDCLKRNNESPELRRMCTTGRCPDETAFRLCWTWICLHLAELTQERENSIHFSWQQSAFSCKWVQVCKYESHSSRFALQDSCMRSNQWSRPGQASILSLTPAWRRHPGKSVRAVEALQNRIPSILKVSWSRHSVLLSFFSLVFLNDFEGMQPFSTNTFWQGAPQLDWALDKTSLLSL